jgi:leucyl aminopeptidase
MQYSGGGDEPPVALVGKGITFDTGGISLKPNENKWQMKGDLGGASVVMGTMLSAAKHRAKINLIAMAPLAENMPSAPAIERGDVLTSMSGQTTEIISTDDERRLVLADSVHYAQINFEQSMLINVATLTGSVGRPWERDMQAYLLAPSIKHRWMSLDQRRESPMKRFGNFPSMTLTSSNSAQTLPI